MNDKMFWLTTFKCKILYDEMVQAMQIVCWIVFLKNVVYYPIFCQKYLHFSLRTRYVTYSRPEYRWYAICTQPRTLPFFGKRHQLLYGQWNFKTWIEKKNLIMIMAHIIDISKRTEASYARRRRKVARSHMRCSTYLVRPLDLVVPIQW